MVNVVVEKLFVTSVPPTFTLPATAKVPANVTFPQRSVDMAASRNVVPSYRQKERIGGRVALTPFPG